LVRIEELGYAIRQARKARKLTQLELASEAGLSRTTLNQLENGLFPDLGIRKVKVLLDRLGLSLEVRPATRESRPDFVQMACTMASVSYKNPLTENELIRALLSGKVPAGKRPHLRTLLDEASPALRKGLIEDVARWSTPGKVERNLAAMREELGITRED